MRAWITEYFMRIAGRVAPDRAVRAWRRAAEDALSRNGRLILTYQKASRALDEEIEATQGVIQELLRDSTRQDFTPTAADRYATVFAERERRLRAAKSDLLRALDEL